MKSRADKNQNCQWTTNDKHRLYNALVALQDKDCVLQTIKQKIEQRGKLSQIKELRKSIKKNRDTLNAIKKEDMKRLKRTLQRHNVYIPNEEHTFDTVLTKVNYKVFSETNELNRLIQEEENLAKIYETKLLDLSKIQDRIVHVDQFQLYDEILSNRLRLDIKNCETRTSSVKTINQLCNKIIDKLVEDLHSFDPALNALKNNIREQNALLDAIINLEIPANKDHQDLFAECKIIKENVDNDMKIRLATLNEFTSKIVTNNEAVKRLIISDDDVKTKSKPSEKVIFSPEEDATFQQRRDESESIHTTSSSCWPFSKQEDDIDDEEEEELTRAEQARRYNEMIMNQLKTDLEIETANKHLIESDLRFTEKILIKIQSSFKHFKQVLRQIGEDFEDQVDLESSSGETEFLVSIVLHRCKVMMAIFNEKVLKNEIPTNKMILYNSDIEEYSENEMHINKDPDIMDDPNVPTRERIKALSAKLVEINLRED